MIVDAPITTGQEQEEATKPWQLSFILTRLHAGYFRITLSLGAQALLWKILISTEADINGRQYAWWHISRMFSSTAFLLLWWFALVTQISLLLLYILRCFLHFNLVKAEFLHYIGVNYLYSPWISCLLLLQSCPLSPASASQSLFFRLLFYAFAIPVVMLDIKLYGQWFTTERKFLSALANPTSQISVIANFVVARAAAQVGWKETAVCMFSLGMVHYLVLFVTLYQRLSGRNNFPSSLRPAFFLFFAAPSTASLAWNSISGAVDTFSKMLFFLSLFLFVSLASRPALFRKSMKMFNAAWWAYSFTLTFLALASSEYAKQVKGHIASGLMLVLSALSVLVLLGLMLWTTFNTDGLVNDPGLGFGKCNIELHLGLPQSMTQFAEK